MNAGLAPCLVCRNSQPSWADGIRLKLARRCPKLSSTPPTRARRLVDAQTTGDAEENDWCRDGPGEPAYGHG